MRESGMEDDVMAIWPLRTKAFSLTLGRKAGAGLIGAAFCLTGFSACAQQTVGTATGLPVPRYVSLKSEHVNLREGPSKDHATKWIYQRAGLPVEITAEYEIWRRIRDSEGAEGWVLHSLLSGKRTVLVSPWKKDAPPFPLRSEPGDDARITAKLSPGVIAGVKKCDGTWCRLKGEGYDGYMPQTVLWGVYPGEKVE
jgi:SH3-like domain-containing protein